MQKNRFLAVAGIGIGLLVLGMIWSTANMALASIQKELFATFHELQWIMNCFGIFICGPLLAMGKLGDVYGRKPFYLLGLAIALVFSCIAGFADRVWVLILCMGFFGFGGSMILPLSQALLVHQFPEEEKDRAVAIWSMFASISLAAGPFVGGLILRLLGWRWIYWINVPFAIIALCLVLLFVQKETEKQKASCDWKSVWLLALIIATLILPIMQGPFWGWSSFPTLGFFAVSFLLLCCMVYFEKRSKHPIFRADLFANRSFLFSAIPNGCTIGFLWVVFFIIPLFLQNILGLTPFQTGSIFLLVTMPVFLFSKTISRWSQKWGYKLIMLIGFILFACVFLLQLEENPTFWNILFSCLFFGFGWVLTWGTSISCALSSVPRNLAGTAAGMFNTVQEFGAVLSLSLAGVFFHRTQKEWLTPHLEEIRSALANVSKDEFESLISNPNEVAMQTGHTAIANWLIEAFLKGYHSIFWFLFLAALFAFGVTLLIPKEAKSEVE